MLVLCWITLIAAGTVALRAPVSLSNGELTWLDALFTSTSAVCVTGLSTINVGADLTGFGQAILLALIQIGGLGIATVSTLLLLIAGQRSLSTEDQASDALAGVHISTKKLVFFAVATTLVVESVGALLLSTRFGGEDAVWSSVFHSVSAFCNAGFSLNADSLTQYATDPAVNAIVGSLIILGGVGFIAMYQIGTWIVSRRRGKCRPLPLHARVVIVTSGALLVLGGTFFLFFEYYNTLSGMSVGEKLLAAAFQSVTTRTAGFNTIDFASLREPMLLLTMLFMLIGGAPGSCAGGVKVTTAVVILAAVRARVRGLKSVPLLSRTIPRQIVARAFYIGTFSILFVGLVILALVITEEVRPSAGLRGDRLTTLAFEAYSAFGTVGLGTGLTPDLSSAGKLIIIFTMFVGRLGPLALAMAVFTPRSTQRYEFPKEDLVVG
jgi:trk system potassium uptake protein TrkH